VAKSGAQGAYTGGKASAAGMGAAVGNIGGRIKGMLIKGK
jgi:conjugative transposon protein traJ